MLSPFNLCLESKIYPKLSFGIVFKHYSQRKHTSFEMKMVKKAKPRWSVEIVRLRQVLGRVVYVFFSIQKGKKKEFFNNKLQQTIPNMNIEKFRYNLKSVSMKHHSVSALEAAHL